VPGGAKTYHLPKNILIFSNEVKKHTILASQGGKSPLLSSPADAHGRVLLGYWIWIVSPVISF